jgi:hypothetical protein
MRRIEFFEIHDQPWFPVNLRNLITDGLQSFWTLSNAYRPIVPLLREALANAGTKEVLDLCSGGGGPWFQLVGDFEGKQNDHISVRLTDVYPNQQAFEKAASGSNSIDFDIRSISAIDVPPDIRGFRTIFSSFHHFPPDDAQRILSSAMESGRGIAIFETARRSLKVMSVVCFLPFLILLLTPWIRPFRWSRFLFTYLIPIVPFVLCFDGLMSCSRSYSQQELSEMVGNLTDKSYYCRGLLSIHKVNRRQATKQTNDILMTMPRQLVEQSI